MEEEFERIVREDQNKIFRLALSLLGDRAAAEQTAQDVLVRVWKGLAGFRAESSLSTWIYAITPQRLHDRADKGRSAHGFSRRTGPAPQRGEPSGSDLGWRLLRPIPGCGRAARPSAAAVPPGDGALLHAGEIV